MATDIRLKEDLPEITEAIVAGYTECLHTTHLGHKPLPSREAVVEVLEDLMDILYPGYVRRQNLHIGNVEYHVGDLIDGLHDRLTQQIARALRHEFDWNHCSPAATPPGLVGRASQPVGTAWEGRPTPEPCVGRASQPVGTAWEGRPTPEPCVGQASQPVGTAWEGRPTPEPAGQSPDFEAIAQQKTLTFLRRLPHVQQLLEMDVLAAFAGDPAAKSFPEIIFCYPGLEAVTVYRLAHELLLLGVPLIPRMLTEHAHFKTGIDIHPGARIGHSFFIDHGTGVVIGETCDIGNHVKLYQGVTLGALSFPRDAAGNIIRGMKRHPTLEDEVVVYANATILGGDTVVGHHAVIGSSVWLTRSVEPYTVVSLDKPSLRIRGPEPDEFTPSYQI